MRARAGSETVRPEVIETLSWKDAAATATTALVVALFAASHEGRAVPLVGSSHRWAAAAIFVVGAGTCGLGDSTGGASRLFAALGIAALALCVITIATGSLTALSLQVAVTVGMWGIATSRRVIAGRGRPSTAT